MDHSKIAVISTGNGGQSLAAYLTLQGRRVALYAREQERIDMFRTNRFTLGGIFDEAVDIDLISCDMRAVVEDAYLVMVTTPAQYHPIVARAMAPHLVDGQTVVLNPGRTFGTYVFDKTLRENGCRAEVLLGETDTFVFTCRCKQVGRPVIFEIKKDVKIAGHVKEHTPLIAETLSALFPNVVPAYSVLQTGLTNIGMIFHPLPILMNITRIEAKEEFRYYIDGISPLVATVLERLDSERVAVARGMGVEVPAAFDWLQDRYGSEGNNLYERIQNTHAYRNVYAPTEIDTRYIHEDIQTGCVPVSCLGRRLNIPTDITDASIKWASVVYNCDFYATGRNESAIDFDAVLAGA
ncbi:MAG TPA: NAD/NADP octopine/nopaline dehydrogenase family protein [Clostridia bacterium]|nr:MAG: Opine dehydrogenase [Firmicutes bacterium ADurb.Bin248]HOG00933.1 NAD/NADP octopine/nopaline dehydrogenase family protein [Clostridia bacterium]HOS18630.1 NAD/NADP octopine/nopaline dehydrogenase family protein [Clostridia bacterium]HPK15312.1 NAD/NADP octopine/nopaline dehydrogenase family protein [Clostridia bacterium]